MKVAFVLVLVICSNWSVLGGMSRGGSHSSDDDDHYYMPGRDMRPPPGGSDASGCFQCSDRRNKLQPVSPQCSATHYNVLETVYPPVYPDCVPGTECDVRRCDCVRRRWWRCIKRQCHSCCANTFRAWVPKTRSVCANGYYGKFCEKAVCSTPCTGQSETCVPPGQCGPACDPPCKLGECVAGSSGSSGSNGSPNTCQCQQYFQGDDCGERIRCSASGAESCQNGGSCTNRGECMCSDDFMGARCQLPATDVCENGGICERGRCLCPSGFTGLKCQISVTTPGPAPGPAPAACSTDAECLNGGVCQTGACLCTGGFTGVNCGTPSGTP